ncbi:hypothetical protein FHE66_04180 [Georgenia sp. 311]|uniref:Uncharacterized protein n=1 Tax=Georgenia wutianyii TaxID=2585135 RepID=A0ABX5VMP5_9MICO|nr:MULTISPECIES: hypothetical protein [Georgenia]QDB79213.1 hypothetical protein FE251_07380 [Georgenia wutianyii]TNC19122.1 hypothetical protein FHE66_04180 [Georgenia sp. 311]
MVETCSRAPAATLGRRWSVLTWLMMVFAVPVPLAVVVAFVPQLQRVGEVSHWPWDEYGVLGWWLVPASLALAAVCGAAREGEWRSTTVRVLAVLAVLTTLALFVDP